MILQHFPGGGAASFDEAFAVTDTNATYREGNYSYYTRIYIDPTYVYIENDNGNTIERNTYAKFISLKNQTVKFQNHSNGWRDIGNVNLAANKSYTFSIDTRDDVGTYAIASVSDENGTVIISNNTVRRGSLLRFRLYAS